MIVTGDRPTSTSLQPLRDDIAVDLAEALFREAHQRRQRRRRAVGAGFMGLLVIAVAVVSIQRVENQRPAPLGIPPASHIESTAFPTMPLQIVAWAQTGTSMTIQVLSSRSGHVVRTLASDLGLFNSTPQPTAAPDGTVYYDTSLGATQQGPGAHPPAEQIVSIPITGGPSTFIADGHDPAVSPDGRYLAYLTWTQITDGPEGVVVVNRLTGAVDRWQYSTNVPDINSISWSPDRCVSTFLRRFLHRFSESVASSPG